MPIDDVSRQAVGGLNLGFHTGDDATNVTRNRGQLQSALQGRPIAWLDQCHGTQTVMAANALGAPPRADAVVSDRVDEVCAIMVADCLPVLLSDRAGRAVGAAHAGWRGLCAGVLEETATTVERLAGNQALLAYLGPSIGPAAFEVGDDVRSAFLDAALPQERDTTAALFHERRSQGNSETKYLADLPGLARLRLARVGITDVYGGTICTFSDAQRFYSYRRDHRTGRFAALIWRTQD